MNRSKKAIAKILISGSLFGFIIWRVDGKSLVANLKLIDTRIIPLVVFLLVLNYVVSSLRWKYLLIYENCKDVSISYLISLYFMGSFFNNFMPTSIGGDVYKIYKLGKKIKSGANAFSSTFMERFTGVIALVLISYVGFLKTLDFWISLIPSNYAENTFFIGVFKLFVLFGFWAGIVFAFIFLKILAKKVDRINKIYRSLIKYKGKNDVLLVAFLTSFVVQLLAIFTQYFVFRSIGVTLPLMYALFIFPVITLASFFIPSLNGIGVQDALYIQFFGVVGISTEVALSASIIYHLLRLSVSLVGGVLYAFDKN